MRPEFLRFIGTMEMRISELEKSLDQKRIERHATKKRLALLRTNCEKIREIMEKYLGSSRTNSRDSQTANIEQKDGLYVIDKDKEIIKQNQSLQEKSPTRNINENSGLRNQSQTKAAKVNSKSTETGTKTHGNSKMR